MSSTAGHVPRGMVGQVAGMVGQVAGGTAIAARGGR